jgi:hypothetical protein
MFFGAVHPCEILVMRQKDHAIQVARKHQLEELQAMKELVAKTLPTRIAAKLFRFWTSIPIRLGGSKIKNNPYYPVYVKRLGS